jgi:hypothetical protein
MGGPEAHDLGPCATTGQSLTRWCGVCPHTTHPTVEGFSFFLEGPSVRERDDGLLDGPAVDTGDDRIEISRGKGATDVAFMSREGVAWGWMLDLVEPLSTFGFFDGMPEAGWSTM